MGSRVWAFLSDRTGVSNGTAIITTTLAAYCVFYRGSPLASLPQPVAALLAAVSGALIAGAVSWSMAEGNRRAEASRADATRRHEIELADERHRFEAEMQDKLRRFEIEKAEKARLLDLYKIVFPDKISAAREVMSKARPLIERVLMIYSHGEAINDVKPGFIEQVKYEVLELNQAITANAWLLGKEVEESGKQLIRDFTLVTRLGTDGLHRLWDRSFDIEMIEKLYNLSSAVRTEVHLAELPMVVDNPHPSQGPPVPVSPLEVQGAS